MYLVKEARKAREKLSGRNWRILPSEFMNSTLNGCVLLKLCARYVLLRLT